MQIVNITATFRLSSPVDLTALMDRESPFVTRNRGFAAVSLRVFTPGSRHFAVTALVFSSGSVVIVGGRSLPQIREARKIVMSKTSLSATALQVRNMACTLRIQPILLEIVYEGFREGKELYSNSYDPELFPAVMVNDRGSRGKACIFHTGRINITGCTSITDALEIKNKLLKWITVYSGEGVTEID